VPAWITMLSMSPGLQVRCNSSWSRAGLRRLPQLQRPLNPRRLGGPYPQRWPLKQMRGSPTCRLLSPDEREPDPVAMNKSWPQKQMRGSPTRRLPSPDKREPGPVARNKSWPLVPLPPVTQVRAYPPAA
jgi:hypothetical protein